MTQTARRWRIGGGLAAVSVAAVVCFRINQKRYHLPSDSVARSGDSLRRREDGSFETDVLVVGSGGGALVAALRARTLGLSVLVTEKGGKVGGTSCFSGSGCWIPNTHVHQKERDSQGDSPGKALEYMESIIGDVGPASSRERKLAYLKYGPEMVKFLEMQGYRWIPTPGYPDYHQFNPGAQIGGRSIEAGAFDINKLGPWKDMLNINPARAPVAMYTFELSKMVRARADWGGKITAAKVFGLRVYPPWILGQHQTTLGVSMISQLIYLNVCQGTSIWTSSPLKELVTDSQGNVTGAMVEHEGKVVQVHTSRGVVLGAGGFAKNAEMRKRHQARGITADWTSTNKEDTGDAIAAAARAGAATALMDSAWWGTSIIDPATNQAYWCLYDRVLPHSIIVDQEGHRFANESQNYNTLGTKLWEHAKAHPTIPAYMIMDSNHRSRYVLAGKLLPGITPQATLDSGFLFKGDSIQDLAKKINVSDDELAKTVKRFNQFVEAGVDADFDRGRSPYDRFLGDPSYPNPNLGLIEKGPFYAVKIWPGDLGTKGGVLTDEHARALKETKKGQYKPIEGLYAVGNSSASVMGRTYAGAGSTLGPGLTFGYIAATHMGSASKPKP